MRSCSSISLHTLDISSIPLAHIPPPANDAGVILPQLIWRNSRITDWRAVDHLAQWTGTSLRSFRFTVNFAHTSGKTLDDNGHRIENDEQHVRLVTIAKLASLESLNSTMITPAERRDAELFYVAHVRRVNSKEASTAWARYHELERKYDETTTTNGAAASEGASGPVRDLVKPGPLRSKQIGGWSSTAHHDAC